MSAQTVFTNGRIYTVSREQPWVTALAVRDGKILARGNAHDMDELIGAHTKVVDLGGKMVMPGIVDVHNHILLGGLSELFELRFPGTLTRTEILDLVSAAAAKAEEGQWIIGTQWGADLNGILNSDESLALLDAASGGNPVLLRDETFHNRWVNSAAMAVAGITQDAADPEQGTFGRDPKSGRLTGLMIEAASGIVERAALEQGAVSAEMNIAAVKKAINTLSAFGVTAFMDAASMHNVNKAVAPP